MSALWSRSFYRSGNGERFLAEALERVMGQTLRSFELLVIDDGSTDGTTAIIDELGELANIPEQLLRYRRHHDTVGLREHRHQLTTTAGGELLLHGPRLQRWLRPPIKITPREKLMVAFPCSNRSYHSVAEITSMAQPRNCLQVHISSSVDAWKRRRF